MATRPQQRAPQASDEDDFYGEEDTEGQDALREERDEDRVETPGAAEHPGEGDPELEEEGELGFEDEELPPPRRGEGRVQRLVNERNEYRRERDEYRRQLEERQPPAQTPQGPRPETDHEFANRISLLSHEEQLNAKFDRFMQQQAAQNQRSQFEAAIQRDRDEFKALCRSDKRYARYADRVEREFERNLRAGQAYPRLNIFKNLFATDQLEGDAKPRQRAREAAQRRVDRQTVKPASGGSDVRASRRERTDERTARARRLEGQQI